MSEENKQDEMRLQESELYFLVNLNKEINEHSAALETLMPKRANLFKEIEERLGIPPGSLSSYDLSNEGVLTKKPRTNPPAVASIAHKASRRNRSKK